MVILFEMDLYALKADRWCLRLRILLKKQEKAEAVL